MFSKSLVARCCLFCAAAFLSVAAVAVEPIKIKVPERPAGQKHVLGLTAPKLDKVRVGFIGVGMRGPGAVFRMSSIEGVEIKAICDLREKCARRVLKGLQKKGYKNHVDIYYGTETAWKKLCERPDIDLVYIATDWKHHAEMGVYAMECGKHVAIEVPSAMTLDEIWALVNTSERTRKHCMQLENCCYDTFELNTLNMAQQGLFGEVIHCEGAYIHNLSEFWNTYWNNWRWNYNKEFRGDVYATHGLGPVCQVLNIHRGDKLKTLVSMDTKAFTGMAGTKKQAPGEKPFQNGDHTMTFISTEKGKTILIEHDVMNPRPYSRMYQVAGLDGFANKYPMEQYSFRPAKGRKEGSKAPAVDSLNEHRAISKQAKAKLEEEYRHPFLRKIGKRAKKAGGHGGMDFVMEYRLVHCLRNGLRLDMDVYDLAEWCSVAELSRISLENGCAPVEVPDFTRGHWKDEEGLKFDMTGW